MSITGFIGFTNYIVIYIYSNNTKKAKVVFFLFVFWYESFSDSIQFFGDKGHKKEVVPSACYRRVSPRTNEDTSKLEPPNVIAFKRQQAHLAHKEASLTWKKGGTMGASHKTWIFNGPFDLIKLCLLSSSLAENGMNFHFRPENNWIAPSFTS